MAEEAGDVRRKHLGVHAAGLARFVIAAQVSGEGLEAGGLERRRQVAVHANPGNPCSSTTSGPSPTRM